MSVSLLVVSRHPSTERATCTKDLRSVWNSNVLPFDVGGIRDCTDNCTAEAVCVAEVLLERGEAIEMRGGKCEEDFPSQSLVHIYTLAKDISFIGVCQHGAVCLNEMLTAHTLYK